MATIWLAHVKAYDSNLASEVTLYYSSSMFVTGTSNLPPGGVANTYYEPRIKQPAIMQQDIFQSSKTYGASQTGYGSLDLVNIDGGLDSIVDYGLDGRRITIILGTIAEGDAAPTWSTVITGTIEQAEVSWDLVSLRIKDRQLELDLPLSQNTYLGNNVLPDGVEGTKDDLKGKRKPKLYGSVFNISPPLVNTSKHIYQVNDGQIYDVTKVYDKGKELTKGADYSSLLDMTSNDPASGYYRVYKTGGYFRLGANPDGAITCDAQEGATSADRTTAQILKRIALTRVTLSDINSSDISALDSSNNSEIGIWIDSESANIDAYGSDNQSGTTCKAAMDEVANSIGAWFGFDSLGVLRTGVMALPSGTPEAVFEAADVVRIDRQVSNDVGRGIPAWKVILNYKKFYSVQNESDLAGALELTQSRIAELKQEYRTIVKEDASIKTKHLLATEIRFDTLLTSESAADTEATRRLNVYKQDNAVYSLRVILDGPAAATLNIGDVIQVIMPRFGMSSGKLLKVIGWKPNLRLRLIDITAWG